MKGEKILDDLRSQNKNTEKKMARKEMFWEKIYSEISLAHLIYEIKIKYDDVSNMTNGRGT